MDLLKINPIKALFWSAILNGVAAVPLIAVIVWLSSNESIMRDWRSSHVAVAWGWFSVTLMGAATLGMFYFMAVGA
jgi:Mn2+/Fe2+ NRAMP family transporter